MVQRPISPTQAGNFAMETIRGRRLHFDAFAGASGDMIIGALLDAGASFETLRADLAKLRLDGYELSLRRVKRAAIDCAKFDTHLAEADHRHPRPPASAADDHQDRDHHHGRGLGEITDIIATADLSERVKAQSILIFRRLAEAEGRVHGIAPEEVHFHEVGAVDAILDVVGACLCLEQLGVERLTASPLRVGFGLVACAHGRYPIPAPGAAELLKGAPFYAGDIEGEFTTPTGAAIIATLCDAYARAPNFTVTHTGYGAGTRDLPNFPNALRVFLGDASGAAAPLSDKSDGGALICETIAILEANLDDQSPQQLGYVMERLLADGALDVFFTPIQMKKQRLAAALTVLCRPEDEGRLAAVIFRETTTLGLRRRLSERYALPRREARVTTASGAARIKIAAQPDGTETATPEYDDCRALAEATGKPLRTIYAEALEAYEKQRREGAE
ncbi:MAG: TIGR00299 family protein [Chloracidobacterium sp. CP2_5A]|nr:MAG: TIGR00299 family protein [Chloracidobacterium sp. CP2_5A]